MPNRRRGDRRPQAIRREEHVAARRVRALSGLLFGAAILIAVGATLSLGELSSSGPIGAILPIDATLPIGDQPPPAIVEAAANAPAEPTPLSTRAVPTPPSPALAAAPATPQPMPAPPRQAASAPLPPPAQASIQREEPGLAAAPAPTAVPPSLASRLAPSPVPLPFPSPSPAPLQSPVANCRIGDSFGRLAALVGEAIVGRCLENEYVNLTTGDSHQRTSRGLLVWVKTRGMTAFTDGETTWYGCADGVRERWSSSPFPC